MDLKYIFDDRFNPSLWLLGLTVAAACFLFIIAHLVLFREDGTSRWGFKPSQSALQRIITNILNGRSDPELSWKWYDYGTLMVLALVIVVVMGWD